MSPADRAKPDKESSAMRSEARAAAGEALPVETTAPTPDATIREGEMEGVLHVVGELGYIGSKGHGMFLERDLSQYLV